MLTYDPDDSTTRDPSWWDDIGGDGPRPYEFASWTYTIVEVEVVEVV